MFTAASNVSSLDRSKYFVWAESHVHCSRCGDNGEEVDRVCPSFYFTITRGVGRNKNGSITIWG